MNPLRARRHLIAAGGLMLAAPALLLWPAPAAGTALGIAISGYSFDAAIAVITGAVLMSVAHHFLKPYLKYLP